MKDSKLRACKTGSADLTKSTGPASPSRGAGPLALAAILLALLASPALAADPSGDITIEENPNAALDFAWVLICGFLVMFMQAGFAMLETGFTRSKNAANIMMKNMMDFSIGALAYWAVGFAVMYGTTEIIAEVMGWGGFFLAGEAYDVSTIESWFFQMVFAATAATIVSGAVAERCKFSTYLIISALITAVIYPLYGHWVWGADSSPRWEPSTSLAPA